MKTIITIALFASLGASAQTTPTDSVGINRSTSSLQQATRATHINTHNNQNVNSAETKMESEIERSTGKPAENPALENPATVRPARIAQPAYGPPPDR